MILTVNLFQRKVVGFIPLWKFLVLLCPVEYFHWHFLKVFLKEGNCIHV